MGGRLNAAQRELMRRTDEVLFYVWDPLNMVDMGPACRDESGNYVPRVAGALMSGADRAAVVALLAEISRDWFGLEPRVERDSEVASLLVDWRESLLGPT